MANFLGHLNNFITLSLSLSLSQELNCQSTYFNYSRACARECVAVLVNLQGWPCCLLSISNSVFI